MADKEVVPATGQQIATRPATAQIIIHRPKELAVYDDIEAEEGAEQEQTKSGALGIIRVLQSGAPQVKKGNAARIEGAEEGDFIDTSTGAIYSGGRGLFFIPVRQYLMYPEYIKREPDGSGGGFLNVYEPENPIVKKAQEARMAAFGNLRGPLPNGRTEDGKTIELVETYYVDSIIIVPDEEGRFPGEYGRMFEGSFAFSSTFIGPYNSWNKRKKTMTYPHPQTLAPVVPRLYTHVFHIRTVPRAKGNLSWMVPAISLGGKDERGAELPYENSKLPRDSFLYQRAAKLREDLLRGAVQLDYSRDSAQAEVGDGGGEPDTLGRAPGADRDPFNIPDEAPWQS